ncbi:MAG: polyprenyl synthetase family protein [Salibacteraceae bacterium]
MSALYAELLKRTEEEIKRIELPNSPSNLYDPIRYIMSLGGKRVRPVLTLLGAKLYSGSYESAIAQAMAVEVFHNFTLVHDDMMDEAALRRQVPTVHKKWNESIALLSGDGMLVLAYQLLAKSDPNRVSRLMQVFSKTALEVCEGQQLDMDYAEMETVKMDDYLEMIRLKTAVLLSGSLKIGAIQAGAPDEDLDRLTVFAESMGLVFQIQDDYLDACGGEEFGKEQGGDIIEGKRTWLTIKAFELGNDFQANRLRKAFDSLSDTERVAEVMAIYSELEIDRLAKSRVAELSMEAISVLNEIKGDQEAKDTLEWLVNKLVKRQV